jgi:hypothetical protein
VAKVACRADEHESLNLGLGAIRKQKVESSDVFLLDDQEVSTGDNSVEDMSSDKA